MDLVAKECVVQKHHPEWSNVSAHFLLVAFLGICFDVSFLGHGIGAIWKGLELFTFEEMCFHMV